MIEYNPLLETFVEATPIPITPAYSLKLMWQAVSETIQERISNDYRKRSNNAAYHLNVLDLIDTEAAAYWREDGRRLYSQ